VKPGHESVGQDRNAAWCETQEAGRLSIMSS